MIEFIYGICLAVNIMIMLGLIGRVASMKVTLEVRDARLKYLADTITRIVDDMGDTETSREIKRVMEREYLS